jgi:pimeloyl-ACP methyl ester carboxylesterase
MGAIPAISRPSLWQSLLEFRAIAELMSIRPARPLLNMAPCGDGQPVLVFPGFFAADNSTASIRKYLNSKGFTTYAWEQGRNPGISQELYLRLEERVLALSSEHGCKVSLVGWSLGGIYARLLAHRIPDHIRQVVTLGSPFKVAEEGAVTGAVARLYERMNPNQQDDPMMQHEPLWRTSPPVPSTAIYSEGDGVAHWSFCIDIEDEHTENVQVAGSHLGMTHNPLVMYAVADRLGQQEGNWRPFQWVPERLRHSLARTRLLFNRASIATA